MKNMIRNTKEIVMSTFRLFPVVFAIVFALFVGPTQSSELTAEITKMLDDLEQVTEVYGEYVERDPFCMQYAVIINGKVVPKLNKIAQKLQQFKREKSFSPTLAKRHSDLSLRLSEVLFKLSDSIGRIEMCVPDKNKNCPTGLTNTSGLCMAE